MYSEDDPPLTLSKWPFYVGDILLVGTALAIGILSDWNLTDWQVASCVVSVALGAALFVLPFIVEFYMRGQEVRDDRSGETRMILRRLDRLESVFENLDEQLEALAADPSLKSRKESGDSKKMEQRLERLDALDSDLLKLRKELNAKIQTVEEATQSRQVDMSSEALASLGARLDALDSQLKERAETSESEEASSPMRVARKKREAGSPLIKRAMKKEQNKPLAAVDRIIQSSPKIDEPVEEVAAPTEVPAPTTLPDPEPVVEPKVVEPKVAEPKVNKPKAVEAPVEKVIEVEPTSSPESKPLEESTVAEPKPAEEVATPAALPEAEPVVEPEVIEPKVVEPKVDKPKAVEAPVETVAEVEKVAEAETATEAEPVASPDSKPSEETVAPEPKPVEEVAAVGDDSFDFDIEVPLISSSDMLFDAADVKTKVGRNRAKKGDTVLTVNALIGIGNKPYIRGNGGGLNWETGIEMEFQEIGKWRWVAPSGLDTPVEIEIYRNDKDQDKGGRHTVEPGQKLEINPSF